MRYTKEAALEAIDDLKRLGVDASLFERNAKMSTDLAEYGVAINSPDELPLALLPMSSTRVKHVICVVVYTEELEQFIKICHIVSRSMELDEMDRHFVERGDSQ